MLDLNSDIKKAPDTSLNAENIYVHQNVTMTNHFDRAYMPSDPLVAILSYLNAEELTQFRGSSNVALTRMNHHRADILWQPFLNLLTSIDSTVVRQDGQSRYSRFSSGFSIINARQMKEIAYIKDYCYEEFHHDLIQMTSALCTYEQPATTLQGLNERHQLLDAINEYIIRDMLNDTTLSFDAIAVTRFPNSLLKDETLLNYWQSLSDLSLNDTIIESLPESIGICANLEHLSCYRNQLTSLPKSLTHCIKLKYLDCSENQLTTLPADLHKLIKLEHLDCSENTLEYIPESIGQCNKLKHLNCLNNKLNKVPDSIGKCSQLKYLDLFGNELINLPESVSDCINLMTLDVSQNKIEVLPKSLGRLSNMQELIAHDNLIKNLPKSLINLKNLLYIDITNNKLIYLTESLENCKDLSSFSCAGNQLATLPKYLGKSAHLSQLDCSYNYLKALPSSIGDLVNLKTLDCSHNKLKTLPNSIGACLNLETLKCNNNKIKKLPKSLQNCLSLTDLSDHSQSLPPTRRLSELSTYSARAIAMINKSQVKELEYFKTRLERGECFTKEIELRLKQALPSTKDINIIKQKHQLLNDINEHLIRSRIMPGTKILGLFHLGITRFPNKLLKDKNLKEYWQNLEWLYCDNNKLKYLPKSIDICIHLRQLNCNDNQLKALPKSLSNCKNLTHLYCVDNNLEILPTDIGKLNKLKILHCADNKIYKFPDSIMRCVNLEEFKFHNNRLTTIPCSLLNSQQMRMASYNNNRVFSDRVRFNAISNQSEINKQQNLPRGWEIHQRPLYLDKTTIFHQSGSIR